MVEGPYGIGKHQVAVACARLLGLKAVELPLGRMFALRMLSTPQELLLDTLLAATPHMSREPALLVVSDGQLLGTLSQSDFFQALLELNRLPQTVLLATTDNRDALAGWPDTVSLPCPGLKGEEEGRRLLAVAYPQLEFADPVAGALCRAAAAPKLGIVPGRLLYVARLAQALRYPSGKEDRRGLFSDDAIAAVAMVRQAWQKERHRRGDALT
jgi:hypothetical protein